MVSVTQHKEELWEDVQEMIEENKYGKFLFAIVSQNPNDQKDISDAELLLDHLSHKIVRQKIRKLMLGNQLIYFAYEGKEA